MTIIIILIGFYTFSMLAIITLNIIGSQTVWISALFIIFFFKFAVLVHNSFYFNNYKYHYFECTNIRHVQLKKK